MGGTWSCLPTQLLLKHGLWHSVTVWWESKQNEPEQNTQPGLARSGNSQSMRVSPRKGWLLGSHSKGLYFCEKERVWGGNTTVLSHSCRLEVRWTDAGPAKWGCVMVHRDGGFRKCYPKIWLEETRPWHPRANCMGYLEPVIFTADTTVALKSWLSVKGNRSWRKSTVGGSPLRWPHHRRHDNLHTTELSSPHIIGFFTP